MHLHDQRTIIRPVLLIFGFRPFRYIYFIGKPDPNRRVSGRRLSNRSPTPGKSRTQYRRTNGNLLQGHLIPGTPRIEGLIADTLNTLSDNDRFQCGAFRKRFRGNLGNSIADISLPQTRTIIEGPFADIGYLVRNDDTFRALQSSNALYSIFSRLSGSSMEDSAEHPLKVFRLILDRLSPSNTTLVRGRAILKSTSAAGFIPQIASHLDNARRNNDFLQPRLSRKSGIRNIDHGTRISPSPFTGSGIIRTLFVEEFTIFAPETRIDGTLLPIQLPGSPIVDILHLFDDQFTHDGPFVVRSEHQNFALGIGDRSRIVRCGNRDLLADLSTATSYPLCEMHSMATCTFRGFVNSYSTSAVAPGRNIPTSPLPGQNPKQTKGRICPCNTAA